MKKFLLFGLVLLLLGSALFADDAKVMPMRLGRLYVAPTYIFGAKAFDADGGRQDTDSALKMFNLGAALEFGAYHWITAAVQWAPGINVWSDIDRKVPNPQTGADSESTVRLFDAGDIFIGAKLQIIGTAAPVKSDSLRLAFGPGVKVPLPGPDFDEQYKNAIAGDPVTPATLDNHVFGFGLRTYFDYLINENFYINLYNETLFYPLKKDIKQAGFVANAVITNIENNGLTSLFQYGDKVDYGYDLTFEIEPAFTMMVAQGVQFNAGLPINYKTTPGKKYDFTYDDAAVNAVNAGMGGALTPLITNIKGLEAEGEQTHLLTLKPGASIFFIGWPLPMEFKLSYTAPLWGKNASANHIIGLQIRAYFRI